ncbi:unnamed protein product [Prunus brigantina]
MPSPRRRTPRQSVVAKPRLPVVCGRRASRARKNCWAPARLSTRPRVGAGLPAEFKHINKRRKRNLQGFPYRQNGSVTSGKGLAARGWARGSRSRTRRLSVDCSSCSPAARAGRRVPAGGRTGARNPG